MEYPQRHPVHFLWALWLSNLFLLKQKVFGCVCVCVPKAACTTSHDKTELLIIACTDFDIMYTRILGESRGSPYELTHHKKDELLFRNGQGRQTLK